MAADPDNHPLEEDDVWLSEKLAVQVLLKEGAVIQEGWLVWEIPWLVPASSQWQQVTEASTNTLAPRQVMVARGNEQPTDEQPTDEADGTKNKKRKGRPGKGEKGFLLAYWGEKGVDSTSAHFQWNYGRWDKGKPSGSMGWAAFSKELQDKLLDCKWRGQVELQHGDREK